MDFLAVAVEDDIELATLHRGPGEFAVRLSGLV